MEFTIYSVGESVFLEQILISVAMISGSGNMGKMAAVGGLLGVIIIMVQAIFQGGRQINFQYVLLGWILYACLFGPTGRILIEDSYTGDVRPVDNVPVSVGIAGGVISKIGYGLTELFEQGFAAIEPGQNRRRYMEALSSINELHRNGNDAAIFDSLNAVIGPNADLRQSWQNYIRECTLTKIDLNEASVDTVMQAPIDEALRFDSSIYGTRLFLAAVEDLTCTEAYPKLTAATAHLKDNPAVHDALNRIMGYSQANSFGEQTPMDKAQGAFDSLMLTTGNAYDFVKTSILEPVYLEAVTGRYQDVRDYSSALMINQAIAQRNMQWAAEQSMFMTVARPLMAFFEGFIYAVTPVLAFLIMLGGLGLTLAVKYVQSLLWIQLWMPTLAVTNLYIHSAASNEMVNKLGTSPDALKSMYALNTISDVLGNWIAVGGMLAAATPIIALFFVTGSTYAFTNLAQRIGGADHVDEKQVTPDVTKSGPYMQMDSKFTGDQVRGMMASGAQSMMSGVTMGGSLSSAVSSAETLQNQKSEAFTDQLSKSWQSAVQQGNSFQTAASLGNALRSSDNAGIQSLVSHAQQVGAQNNWSKDKTDAYIGESAIKGSLGAGGGGAVSASAGVEGKASNRETDGSSFSFGEGVSLADAASLGFSNQASLASEVAKTVGSTSSQSFVNTLSDTDGQNLSRTASELASASSTYTALDQMQTSGGATLNTDMFTLGSHVAGNQQATNELNALWQGAPAEAKREAARLQQRYMSDPSQGGYGLSAGNALAAARLTALTNSTNFREGGFAESFNAVAGVVGTATGRNLGVDADPSSNAGLTGPGAGDVRGSVGGAVGGPERFDADVARTAAHGDVGGEGAVYAHYGSGYSQTYKAGESGAAKVTAETRNEAVEAIMAGGNASTSKTVNAGATLDTTLGQLGEYATSYFGGAVAAYRSGGDIHAGGAAGVEKLKEDLYDGHWRMGRDMLHLTPDQANVYASYGSHQDSEQLNAAYQGLWEANRHANPGMSSDEVTTMTRAMETKLMKAAHHGPAAAGTNVMDIQKYNMMSEPLVKGR